jgi:hypothetical protein
MTLEQQEKYFEKMVSDMRSMLFKKGNDYANTDRLSNFKLAGSICGLTPELNALSLIATKVARLGVLLKSDSKPNNESIQDSVLDLANYSILLSMILADKPEEGQIFINVNNEMYSPKSNPIIDPINNFQLRTKNNI